MTDLDLTFSPLSECLDDRPALSTCSGTVEYRHPLSATGRSFPRCTFHWDLRLREQARIDRLYPDTPFAPSDFDPLDAGERWDYDY